MELYKVPEFKTNFSF
uniref:Uncharacterized protein n=1 Tax=Anguilla anguilla TaxID=7936 RepID=A0A0E9PMP3_ANGAN